ncbi:MAG: VOC family protein [Phyllobacteriaceae bacterium]|nr:VOC family protein [Phyllobacteriaceae bacterium]
MTKPDYSAVWFEIPVRDLGKAKQFYGTVLDIGFIDQTDGPNPIAIFDIEDMQNKPAGHLYPGTPSSRGNGPTIHLAVRNGLESGMERVGQAGGKVVSPAIKIPAGRFAYCEDPDGNSFALFER